MRKSSFMSAPFAHLLGLAPKAEEEDEKTRKAKGKRAEDDEPKGKKAEEDDQGPDAEEDDQEPGEDDEPKGKKAKGKRAEEDDEPDAEEDEEDEPKGTRAAVAADRARCATIVAHGLKSGSVEQACVFAFDTNMSAASAISAMNAASAVSGSRAGRGGLRERMGGSAVPPVGGDDAPSKPAGMSDTAAAIVRAAERAQGGR